MPDPGEPHEPREQDYQDPADYDEAAVAWARMTNPPEQVQLKYLAMLLAIEAEKFLEDRS